MKEKEIEEVKKIEFSDIEANLKEQFDLLMSNPEKFDISTKTQEKINNLSDYAKKAGYKLLVKNAKAAILKQNNEEMAKTLKLDLEEDKVLIKNKNDLERLFKNPEKGKWKLEPEMIKHIQDMKEEEKNDLMEEFAEVNNIDIRSVGRKILDSFKKLWAKLEPVFEKILETVGVMVSDIASKAITKKMGDNELSKVLSEGVKTAIKETTEIIEETTKVNSSKIIDLEGSIIFNEEVKMELAENLIDEVIHENNHEEVKIEAAGNVIHELIHENNH